jgi:D-beta-D-heptose 7-phosphate kinase/D-beta-D-heptose 1-phosphate adenosyltransferase
MRDYLDSFGKIRVAVIGDVMLDCYLAGDVTRISPEAPVPVMRVTSESMMPGGAANVAANLASLGVAVTLVGVTGQDNARSELIESLQRLPRVDFSEIIDADSRKTIKKLRIIGSRQQIVRVDYEGSNSLSQSVEKELIDASIEAVSGADVVVISDYGKGVVSDQLLQQIIAYANAHEKIVIVDPKRQDFSAYRGAFMLTPNRQELTAATRLACGTDEEAAAATAKAQQASAAHILLTRSDKGMSLYPLGGEPVHLATVAQDIFDVSGAGDTVVAVVAASLASGMPMIEAMRLANHAAGIVVSKLGTATVTCEELYARYLSNMSSPDADYGRLVDVDQAMALRTAWAQEKQTVGITNGCFDLLHPGHISLIRQAAESCDRLIVALNSDRSVSSIKGPTRPIQSERDRAQVIGAIRGVAAVVIFDEDTPLALIGSLQPDVLIKGADYRIEDVVGADIVQAGGGRVVLAKLEPGHSTTGLVARF